MTRPTAGGPLHGVRVLDLTRNLAGPYCTMALADLGADVIKVEAPAGDDTRRWQPPSWRGESATFLSANRGKRAIVLDLDAAEGQAAARGLAATADVLVESFRPGALARRGLDHEAVSALNPAVVYCSISAYGSRGPKRDLPGYDPVIQADTGIMAITGQPDGPPARLGIGAVDLGTALWATIGIQGALIERARTGRGAHIEASLYETGAWWLSYHLMGHLGTGEVPPRQGTGTPFIAPYEVFDARDGGILVAAANDRLFAVLADELGAPELAADRRFRGNADRVARKDELRALLAPRFAADDAAGWERRLRARSVPCSAVRSVADLAVDPQLDALGLLRDLPHPAVPDLRVVDMPMSIDGVRGRGMTPPPTLGQHDADVLGADDPWRHQSPMRRAGR
ncbi:CaiB/BaiF CoA transferase family protein [Microbacterium marinilacus]|uniref:CoA transferase n=1 Tax=Microbacterium marinilacus TaxID=415209 RepID=A0ABP7BPA3_9MICO|nr:CoA transferase [Microbacterium marinilacus]MBY0690256.1 CoA transferase [Microbacterium marinilacus]